MSDTKKITISEANKLIAASPARKLISFTTIDSYEHGWEWERYSYPRIAVVGSGPQPADIEFVRCAKSGVCRTINVEEHYNGGVCDTREKQIKVVIVEKRRIEFNMSADTEEEAKQKALQIQQDYTDGNIAYGDIKEVLDINGVTVDSVMAGEEIEQCQV